VPNYGNVTIQHFPKSCKLQATTTRGVVVFSFKNKICLMGKFQNIPLKTSVFFHFGKSKLAPRRGVVEARGFLQAAV